MTKTLLISLYLLVAFPLWAQKEVLKQWDAGELDTLYIRSDALAAVNVSNATDNNLYVRARFQGELAGETVIIEKRLGRTLDLGTSLTPYFTPANDKLAAHKVLAVDLEIAVPRDKAVVVYTKDGSVSAKGQYRFFEVALENGNCSLNEFSGEGRLYTVHGFIKANCLPGVSGRALSKSGKVENSLQSGYPMILEAESIYGDVLLLPIR